MLELLVLDLQVASLAHLEAFLAHLASQDVVAHLEDHVCFPQRSRVAIANILKRDTLPQVALLALEARQHLVDRQASLVVVDHLQAMVAGRSITTKQA